MTNAAALVFALAAGWLLGGLGNWLADALPAWSPQQTPGAARPVSAPLAPPQPAHWRALVTPYLWRARPRLVWLIVATMGAALLAVLLIPSPAAWLAIVYAALLLTILVIDLEQRRVLNVMLGPAALLAVGLSLLAPPPTLWMALAGGLIGFVIFILIGLVGRGAMGGGDVKLMGLVGLMVGYPAIFAAMIYGIVLGGAAALFLLVSRKGTRKSTFAYAPYLALGALVTIFVLYRP